MTYRLNYYNLFNNNNADLTVRGSYTYGIVIMGWVLLAGLILWIRKVGLRINAFISRCADTNYIYFYRHRYTRK